MSKQGRDVAGNALASAEAYSRAMIRASEQIMRFERIQTKALDQGVAITHINVKLADVPGANHLVIIKGYNEDGKFVGFAQGDTVLEAIRTAIASLENGSMKFKEDQYG